MLQALAIKYRPKTFDELIGQESVRLSLKFALQNQRLAHAYLFSGLRGSGKTSSARIFARALVCEKGVSATPCGECESCKAALLGKHIDIIEMDAASNRGLEDIQALIEQTKYAPALARYKIFIIDEVHMLTPQAANALLKTLEEPPSYVKFILATTDPLKLPATVLSRTQHFRFKQISQSEIIKHLQFILEQEKIPYEEEALKFIARSGSGSLRDTLTLLDQAIVYSQNEINTEKITAMLGFLDPAKIKEFYAVILQKDREKVFEFLKDLQDYEASSVIDELIFYLKESFFAKSDEFSPLMYERFFRILSRAKTMLSVSDDDGFVLCIMAFMMMEASNLKQIDELIAQKSVSEKTPPQAEIPSSFANKNPLQKNEEKDPYKRLLAVLYDRDYELASAFERATSFVSFENEILHLSSRANEADKELLNRGFKLIKELARKSLNAELKITKELQIDETKLQSLTKKATQTSENSQSFDREAHIENFKQNAKIINPQDEAKQALDELFGVPNVEE